MPSSIEITAAAVQKIPKNATIKYPLRSAGKCCRRTMRWVGERENEGSGWLVYSLKVIINGSGGHSYVKIFSFVRYFSSMELFSYTKRWELRKESAAMLVVVLDMKERFIQLFYYYFTEFSFFLHFFVGLWMSWDINNNPCNAIILRLYKRINKYNCIHSNILAAAPGKAEYTRVVEIFFLLFHVSIEFHLQYN